MPAEEWVRARAFAWMSALLHFDKVMQIPCVLVHEVCGVGYREIFEAFTEGSPERYPILTGVQALFRDKARDIQNGGPEYCRSEERLNIWWPTDEYVLIKLCVEGKLDAFYQQAEARLRDFLKERFLSLPQGLLHEAILLNRSLLKMPYQTEDLNLELSHNLWEFYRGVLEGRPVVLDNTPSRYRIDRTSKVWHSWDDWCREVIWWGNKRGAYLYGNEPLGRELAGHY